MKTCSVLFAVIVGFQLCGADYTLTDLGPGSAVDVNNSGTVALNDGVRAYRIINGERQHLRIVVGEFFEPVFRDEATATAINDVGNVVGQAIGFFEPVAFLDRGETNRWLNVTVGLGVNNFDQAVGYGLSSQTPGGQFPLAAKLSFWPTPEMKILAPQNYGELRAINDAGVAVGLLAESKTVGSIPEPYRYSAYRARAVKVHGSQITFLDSRSPGDLPIYHNSDPSVRLSEANAVNAGGAVVGAMAVTPDGPKHAFRHAGAGLEDLGTLGGDSSAALAINDSGVIVGESKTSAGAVHACLWSEGNTVDLNSLLPVGTGFTLIRARAVNNAGQIVGDALLAGAARAFLLSPAKLGFAPTITGQPVGGTMSLGGSLTLRVTATGSVPLSYQWKRDNAAIEGATGAELGLTNLTALAQGEYRVLVSNAFGSAISQPASVSVLDPKLTALNLSGLRLEGAVGVAYRIEATPVLGPENWQPVSELILTNAIQLWVDWDSISHPTRIYRALRLP